MMKKQFLHILGAAWMIGGLAVLLYLGAQAQSSRVLFQGDVACPGLPSTPKQIFASHSYRTAYVITNADPVGGTIRLGYGTGSVQLSSTAAVMLSTGGFISDGLPSVSISEIRCQSISAATVTITAIEFGK